MTSGLGRSLLEDASDIASLLQAHEAGDPTAFDRLVPLVYDELRRLARRHLRRVPGGHTLNTTGLVGLQQACDLRGVFQEGSPEPGRHSRATVEVCPSRTTTGRGVVASGESTISTV